MHATSPRYTGAYRMMPPSIWALRPPGQCGRCGEPSGACGCGCRECRKEAKELLAVPAVQKGQTGTVAGSTGLGQDTPTSDARPQTTQAQGFIGGSCCVSLSVEYAPQTPTAAFAVEVGVEDSEGTTMAWRHNDAAGTGYRVKEGIITTKPGAKLFLSRRTALHGCAGAKSLAAERRGTLS